MTDERYETAMGLLNEAASKFEKLSDDPSSNKSELREDDIVEMATLGKRIRSYLSTSRPTTTLGMPHLVSTTQQLSDEMIIRRSEQNHYGHVRIVSDSHTT